MFQEVKVDYFRIPSMCKSIFSVTSLSTAHMILIVFPDLDQHAKLGHTYKFLLHMFITFSDH